MRWGNYKRWIDSGGPDCWKAHIRVCFSLTLMRGGGNEESFIPKQDIHHWKQMTHTLTKWVLVSKESMLRVSIRNLWLIVIALFTKSVWQQGWNNMIDAFEVLIFYFNFGGASLSVSRGKHADIVSTSKMRYL